MMMDREFFNTLARLERQDVDKDDMVIRLTEYVSRLLVLVPESSKPQDIVDYLGSTDNKSIDQKTPIV